MNGDISQNGSNYYQQYEDKLMLISKEAYDAIQEKNKAKIKTLKELQEAKKQQWLKEFSKEVLNADETYKQLELNK